MSAIVSSLNSKRLSRRAALQYGAVGGVALSIARMPTAWAAGSDNLTSLSTVQIARAIAAGEVSAVDAVKACLARIDAVNPKINAVVALCRERALAEAEAADAARVAGKRLGALHGVP